VTAVEAPAPALRPAGWRIVAAKEFADGLLSARFTILLLVVGLAALAATQTAADTITDVASEAQEDPSVFLRLFTLSPERIPSVFALVGFLGPLLGIAFGFDAVNNERAQRTLPRLVAHPIHRDDVVVGKFLAGLALIGLALVVLAAVVTGLGILRLGVTPSPVEVARLACWLALSVIYVGVWLAAAMLCSVLMRRAATSALVALAAWLVLTVFAGLLVGLLADAVAPSPEQPLRAASTVEDVDAAIHHAEVEQTISRFSPETLYEEAASALLSPEVRTLDVFVVTPADRAIPGRLPLPQSILLAGPQLTGIVAVIVVLFTATFAVFMRQEIRA
jgi:ABC-2 type transport system permease protein